MPAPLAPAGQFYVYPSGNLSNAPGPGAIGPFTEAEARNRASGIKVGAPANTSTTFTPISTIPGVSTDIASGQLQQQHLTGATNPPTPQFIQPYQRVTGAGAFGESDVNPFATNKRMI